MTVCVPLCLKRPEDCHVHVPTNSWQEGKPMAGGGWPILWCQGTRNHGRVKRKDAVGWLEQRISEMVAIHASPYVGQGVSDSYHTLPVRVFLQSSQMKPCQGCPDAITAGDTLKAQAGRAICASLARRPAKLVNDRGLLFLSERYSSVFQALMQKMRFSSWGYLETEVGGRKLQRNDNCLDVLYGKNSVQDKNWPAENCSAFLKMTRSCPTWFSFLFGSLSRKDHSTKF